MVIQFGLQCLKIYYYSLFFIKENIFATINHLDQQLMQLQIYALAKHQGG